jgi:hypothetical protein
MEEIKVIKLINGDDIVCSLSKEQLPEKVPLLRLDKPLQIKYVSQLTPRGLRDYIALIKWVAYTNDKIITIPKDKIVTITNATDEMSKSYLEVSSKYERIDSPKKSEYQAQEMTLEENDEFNELWDSFRDRQRTLH